MPDIRRVRRGGAVPNPLVLLGPNWSACWTFGNLSPCWAFHKALAR